MTYLCSGETILHDDATDKCVCLSCLNHCFDGLCRWQVHNRQLHFGWLAVGHVNGRPVQRHLAHFLCNQNKALITAFTRSQVGFRVMATE